MSFDQVESYCSCKSEWTYPCTDGVARNGCDQNSCGAPSHARYCPATDASCETLIRQQGACAGDGRHVLFIAPHTTLGATTLVRTVRGAIYLAYATRQSTSKVVSAVSAVSAVSTLLTNTVQSSI